MSKQAWPKLHFVITKAINDFTSEHTKKNYTMSTCFDVKLFKHRDDILAFWRTWTNDMDNHSNYGTSNE